MDWRMKNFKRVPDVGGVLLGHFFSKLFFNHRHVPVLGVQIYLERQKIFPRNYSSRTTLCGRAWKCSSIEFDGVQK